MIDIIKKVSSQVAKTSGINIMEAIITKEPPEIEIKIKNNDKLIIPKDLIIVSEHLLEHTRIATIKMVEHIDSETDEQLTSPISGTSKTCQGAMPPINFTFQGTGTSLDLTHKHILETFTMEDGEITFRCCLKEGDKVMVIAFEEGQKYYIMDKVVS
ncbi:DUF2577 family protein [Dethiothermospora halolimnae]|uniref:DUF2577 family protein n=1 Tax=Dethiothermospora halolimnae TaxID=3114390 RepID=UPI003CCB7F2A